MQYSIVCASPEQEREANRREGAEWGPPLLTPQHYIDREHLLLHTDLSRNRRHKWVMVTPDDPASLDFLASCETHRRVMLVLKPGQPQPVRAITYSIASVFVPLEKRKRGYATRMMALLHQRLSNTPQAPHSAPVHPTTRQHGPTKSLDQDLVLQPGSHGGDATASFLYSDIGNFYEPYGWKLVGPRHVEWSVQLQDAGLQPPSDAKWLEAEQLAEIAQLDQELLRRLFAEAAAKPQANDTATGTAQKILFALDDPTASAWRWRVQRDKFAFDRVQPQPPSRPTRYGIILPSSTGQPGYAAWTFDAAHQNLVLLRLHFVDQQQLETLVGILKAEAAKHGMTTVEAWNVDLAKLGVEIDQEQQARLCAGGKLPGFGDKLAGGILVERSQVHLPSVAWYGSRSGEQQVDWLLNEYGWYI
ncbi:hypothetical protein ACQY0O_003601 [Thecaphora frezii]